MAKIGPRRPFLRTKSTFPPSSDPSAPGAVTAVAVEEIAEEIAEDLEEPLLLDDETDIENKNGGGADAVDVGLSAEETSSSNGVPYGTLSLAQQLDAATIARTAVEEYAAKQAEARLFDVIDGTRIVLTLALDDIDIYRRAWEEHNATTSGDRLPFSTYLSRRLRACRTHTAVRPIYMTDIARRRLETLLDNTVLSDQDLVNQVERRIRPLLECPPDSIDASGTLRLPLLNPLLYELVPNWFPHRSKSEAIGEFVAQAVNEKLGR